MKKLLLLVLSAWLSSVIFAASVEDLMFRYVNEQLTVVDCNESATGELVIPEKVSYSEKVVWDKLDDFFDDETVQKAFKGGYTLNLNGNMCSNGVITIGESPILIEGVPMTTFRNANGMTIAMKVSNVTTSSQQSLFSFKKSNSENGFGLFLSSDGGLDGMWEGGNRARYNSISTPFPSDGEEYVIVFHYLPSGTIYESEESGCRAYSIDKSGAIVQHLWDSDLTTGESTGSPIAIGGFTDNTQLARGMKIHSLCFANTILPIDNFSLTDSEVMAPVTAIGSSAFHGCSGLTSVTIPEGVTAIGNGAFYGCSGLTSITIPSSVTFIGSSAFRDCSGLTSVTILEGVTSIGEYAFYNCSSLTSVTIPSSVTSIGGRAFYNCSSLTSVTIPEGVTSIGEYAFYGCSGLTSVTIPSSVTSIGVAVFNWSSSLREVTCLGAPPRGWKDASVSSSAIVHYPLEHAAAWEALLSSSQATGTAVEAISSADVSVEAEMTTPKTMKVTYTIHSEKRNKAKVYALAFEDGVRSFAKVVPVKTAATDSPEAVPNGREVTTNEPHTFIWNVPADWDTDLAKVMVEILVQEGELLPMESVTIPANGNHAEMTISTNVLRTEELFNALLWCCATEDTALTNVNGVVKVNGTQIANGTSLYSSYSSNCNALLNYLYGKMGYKVLSGSDLTYAQKMTRLPLSSSGLTQVAIKVATASASEE